MDADTLKLVRPALAVTSFLAALVLSAQQSPYRFPHFFSSTVASSIR